MIEATVLVNFFLQQTVQPYLTVQHQKRLRDIVRVNGDRARRRRLIGGGDPAVADQVRDVHALRKRGRERVRERMESGGECVKERGVGG